MRTINLEVVKPLMVLEHSKNNFKPNEYGVDSMNDTRFALVTT